MANWIVGENALPTIIHLTQELHKKILNKINSKYGTSCSRYLPWMSMPEPSVDIVTYFTKAIEDVICEQSYLDVLCKEFFKNEAELLGKLDLDSDHVNMYIYKPSSDLLYVQSAFREGRALLLKSSPFFAALYPILIQTIVPMKVKNSDNSRAAFSSHELRGAIFRAVPDIESPFWRIDLAIDLAHEIGHQALIVYQAADRIISSELEVLVTSGVRKVPRPAIMSFHAVAALAYMVFYLRDQTSPRGLDLLNDIEKTYAKSELARYENDLMLGIRALDSSCKFTQVGELIYSEYKALLKV